MSTERSIEMVIRAREPLSLLTRLDRRCRSRETNPALKISPATQTKIVKSKRTRPKPEAKTGKDYQPWSVRLAQEFYRSSFQCLLTPFSIIDWGIRCFSVL